MRHILLALFSIVALIQNNPKTQIYTAPYTVTYEYKVSVEYPNIFISTLAFLGGIVGAVDEPDQVFYDERILCDSSKDCFELTVCTDEKKVWLFVAGNDTSNKRSFSELPRDERFPLLPKAISFIARFRALLNDSSMLAFSDTFFYGDRDLIARVSHNKETGQPHVRRVSVESVERDNPEISYMHADIDVHGTPNSYYYSKVFVHLKKSDVKITLLLADIKSLQ